MLEPHLGPLPVFGLEKEAGEYRIDSHADSGFVGERKYLTVVVRFSRVFRD